jgi:hypothetical protein
MKLKLVAFVCLSLFLAETMSCGSATGEAEFSTRAENFKHEHEDPHSEISGELHLDLETVDQAGIRTDPSLAIFVQEYVQATGVVGPDESRLSHIRPLSEGIVHQVFVQEGDRVQEGQPLISYDSIELGELVGGYQSHQAELRGARAKRDVKQRLWERGKELFNHQVIAEKELELREADYIDAREVVRKWEAAIAQVELKLHRYGLPIQELRSVGEVSVPRHLTLTELYDDRQPGDCLDNGRNLRKGSRRDSRSAACRDRV